MAGVHQIKPCKTGSKAVSDRCKLVLRNASSIEISFVKLGEVKKKLLPSKTSHHSTSFLPASAALALFNSLPFAVQSSTSHSTFFAKLNEHFSHDKFLFGLTWTSFFIFVHSCNVLTTLLFFNNSVIGHSKPQTVQ